MGVTGSSVAGTGVAGTSTNGSGTSGSSSYIGVSGQGGSYGGVFTSSAAGSHRRVLHREQLRGLLLREHVRLVRQWRRGCPWHRLDATVSTGVPSSNGVYGTGSTGVSGHGGSIGVFGGDASNSGVRGDSTYVGVWGTGNTWGDVRPVEGHHRADLRRLRSDRQPLRLRRVLRWQLPRPRARCPRLAGAFKIDHPLDPENKWLSHSFVESPDMMNVVQRQRHPRRARSCDGAAAVVLLGAEPRVPLSADADRRARTRSAHRP